MNEVIVIAGWVLVAAGIALGAWALFWDRSRGRRRCPRCWYDMAGVPGLRCPECGRDAKRERKLFKTRRRWRFIVLSALLMYLAFVPRHVYLEGWTGILPTPLLLAAVYMIPGPAGDPPWQYSLLPLNTNAERNDAPAFVRAAELLRNRADRSGPSSITQRATHRVALTRADRELSRWPPRLPESLKELVPRGEGSWADCEGPLHLATVWLEVPSQGPAGEPLHAIAHVAGLGDPDIIADIQAGWPGAPRIRISGPAPCAYHRSSLIGWPVSHYTPVVCLGTPPSPAPHITVTTHIRRGNVAQLSESQVDALPIVATRRVRIPVRIEPEGVCHLIAAPRGAWPMNAWSNQPDRPAGAHMILDPFEPDGSLLMLWGSGLLEADLTYGVILSVKRNGEPLYTGELCVWRGMGMLGWPWGSSTSEEVIDVALRPVTESADLQAEAGMWTVQMTGDRSIARMRPSASYFWSGEIELPLTVQIKAQGTPP